MTRRDLSGRETYPTFEPMAWSDEMDAEMPTSRIVVRGLIVFGFCLILLGVLWT